MDQAVTGQETASQETAARETAGQGGVAVFDFDCTLTRVDSLLPWLRELAGPWRMAVALVPAAGAFLGAWGRGWGARRTAFKDALLVHVTRGRSVTSAQAAAERLGRHLRWLAAVIPGLDLGSAERIVQRRARAPYKQPQELITELGPAYTGLEDTLSTGSRYFEVIGRLRLDDRVFEERSIVARSGQRAGEVTTVLRERRSIAPGVLP